MHDEIQNYGDTAKELLASLEDIAEQLGGQFQQRGIDTNAARILLQQLVNPLHILSLFCG
jgi:hypothetical protein